MDYIRAVLKGVFYDYPENEVRKMFVSHYSFSDFENCLIEILSHTNQEYSRSEIKCIWEYISTEITDPPSDNSKNFNPFCLFKILSNFGMECLLCSSVQPCVRFDNLLRWRGLSYYISEDLITTATLATYDLHNGSRFLRKFVWPDVLRHDNTFINQVIDEGLADTHAHIFASSDIFQLNWIAMMNRPEMLKESIAKSVENSFFDKAHFPLESETIVGVGSRGHSVYQLGLLAALCRAYLFTIVNGCGLTEFIESYLFHTLEDNFDYNATFDAINILRQIGLKSRFHTVLDYAITAKNGYEINTPYFILSGERKLLYDSFRFIFSRGENHIFVSKVLYLYIILKNRIRREMVQTNMIVGFDNFQLYQNRKMRFLSSEVWENINFGYAVYSALGDKQNNAFEGRISPKSIDDILSSGICFPFDLWESEKKVRSISTEKVVPENFSLVVHFIKRKINLNSHCRQKALAEIRASLWDDTNKILNSRCLTDRITGIDVAGSELNCRPEVFAPMFRWAKAQGMGNNMTFHAGEDFYDIIDGLRTIFETVVFMDFEAGCRIGHALALGKDPQEYYHKRHFNVIAPAQIILDNLIWMKFYALENNLVLSSETAYYIEKEVYNLTNFIGYPECREMDYWRSMLMRGFDWDLFSRIWSDSSSQKSFAITRDNTIKPRFWETERLRLTNSAKELYKSYETDCKIFKTGGKPISLKLPYSFVDDVGKIQECLMADLKRRGIIIEANPSSNLRIGGFAKYEDLPLFRMFKIDIPAEERMLVSVNTDDRGIFATSLANEYSLVAASLFKKKDKATGKPIYSLSQIEGYIRQLAENGKRSRFKP